MTHPDQLPIDWQRATLFGAVNGGVFWGLAAGAILISNASAFAVIAIGLAAAVAVIAGALTYRGSDSPRHRATGIGLVLAPLTGAAPLIAALLPGLFAQAFFWNR